MDGLARSVLWSWIRLEREEQIASIVVGGDEASLGGATRFLEVTGPSSMSVLKALPKLVRVAYRGDSHTVDVKALMALSELPGSSLSPSFSSSNADFVSSPF
jgi:hypothetical protein